MIQEFNKLHISYVALLIQVALDRKYADCFSPVASVANERGRMCVCRRQELRRHSTEDKRYVAPLSASRGLAYATIHVVAH